MHHLKQIHARILARAWLQLRLNLHSCFAEPESPNNGKESQALGMTKSLISLSQPSLFVYPWRKPHWTDHNHIHIFALRNAGRTP